MSTARSEFIVALIEDLEARLVAIDRERGAIRSALRALGTERLRNPGDLDARIVEALAATPGARASMIALEFRLPISRVRKELEVLHASGVVEKQGLGWKVLGD